MQENEINNNAEVIATLKEIANIQRQTAESLSKVTEYIYKPDNVELLTTKQVSERLGGLCMKKVNMIPNQHDISHFKGWVHPARSV